MRRRFALLVAGEFLDSAPARAVRRVTRQISMDQGA